MTLRQYIESLEAIAKQHGDQIRVVSRDYEESRVYDNPEPSVGHIVKGADQQARIFLGERVLARRAGRGGVLMGHFLLWP